MTVPRRRLAALLGAGLVLAAPAGAAADDRRPVKVGSSTTTTSTRATPVPAAKAERALESLQSRCVAAIDVRLRALSTVKKTLAAAPQVTGEHRAALTALLDDTITSLQALRGEITAATEDDSLRRHCRSIFGDNRVFALVLPRTRLVVASDVSGAVADKLDGLAAKLDAAIGKAEAAGRDMAQARADLEAMRAKVASSRTSAASVPGAVLGLTPADWNADHKVLVPARESLQEARSDLRAARQLAGKIRDQLKAQPQA